MILLVLICSTKVSENLTWQNPEPLDFAASRVEELFVAQVLIKKVKLKCCGIKKIQKPWLRFGVSEILFIFACLRRFEHITNLTIDIDG